MSKSAASPSQGWLDAQNEPSHPLYGLSWDEARAAQDREVRLTSDVRLSLSDVHRLLDWYGHAVTGGKLDPEERDYELVEYLRDAGIDERNFADAR